MNEKQLLARERKREADRKYNRSVKGRERQQRYNKSWQGRERNFRYNHSWKGEERNWKYEHSFKGQYITRPNYRISDVGIEVRRRSQQKYNAEMKEWRRYHPPSWCEYMMTKEFEMNNPGWRYKKGARPKLVEARANAHYWKNLRELKWQADVDIGLYNRKP